MAKTQSQEVKEPVQEKKEPCQVTFFLKDESREGTTTHFSERGVLVVCPKPAPLNSKVKLVLHFPGFKNTVEAQGEVVWTNLHGPDDTFAPRGMGVKFVNLERETERLMADMAAHYQEFGSMFSCYFT